MNGAWAGFCGCLQMMRVVRTSTARMTDRHSRLQISSSSSAWMAFVMKTLRMTTTTAAKGVERGQGHNKTTQTDVGQCEEVSPFGPTFKNGESFSGSIILGQGGVVSNVY